MTILCIWHAGCIDGFGSATVVKKKFPEAEFHAGVYQKAPPDVTGKDVYIVDFSYKRSVIEKMLETAKTITIIDHHKSAIKDLKDLYHPKLTKFFVIEHSGAVLTWMYLFPELQVPMLLRHIEDRDLWNHTLPDTDAICASLYSHEFDFDLWNTLYEDIPYLIREGIPLVRVRKKAINSALKQIPEVVQIGGYYVKALNVSPAIASEVAQGLSENHMFGAVYHDINGRRVFSLRSTCGFDVSEIAVQYGGGGHKAAAGFSIETKLMKRIVPSWKLKLSGLMKTVRCLFRTE